MSKKLRALTIEEHRAIREYGNTYGRTWKAAVRELWMRAIAHDDTEALVYALRNSHGPRWLIHFSMADAREAVFKAAWSGNTQATWNQPEPR